LVLFSAAAKMAALIVIIRCVPGITAYTWKLKTPVSMYGFSSIVNNTLPQNEEVFFETSNFSVTFVIVVVRIWLV
jgi:hypothetical protein